MSEPSVTSCTVVIAAHDERRLPLLERAVASAAAQGPAVEVVVAVDNNPSLLESVRRRLPRVRPVLNDGERGASATRNAGARAATGSVLAFLDDDAEAAPGWLERLLAPLQHDTVVGVGGWVEPAWAGRRPAWFPDELGWVVGASYTGLPTRPGPVRNGWSENMAVRADDFWRAGGFREGFGKVGSTSRPEDTELCLRMTAQRPGGHWWIEPSAVVRHHVPADRATLRFLLRRCRAEGAGKAELARLAGPGPGLSTERRYVVEVLPRAVLTGLLDPVRGRWAGPARAAVVLLGLVGAALGFAEAKVRSFRTPPSGPVPGPVPTPACGPAPGVPHFDRPARVLAVDLATRLPALPPPAAGEVEDAAVLVTVCGRPVGMTVFSGPATPAELAAYVEAELGERARAEGRRHGLPARPVAAAGWIHDSCPVVARRERLAADGPRSTVVVCTRDRPQELRRCLDSIARLDYRNLRVLVVDNAPTDDQTEKVCRDRPMATPPVDYVREPTPGLSYARNRALREIDTEVVAFVDDDEVVDRHWLSALVEELTADPAVGAVTGVVLPADLPGPAEVRFEQWGGHSKGRGFVRTVLDREHQRTVQPAVYPKPTFGAGANMAFRRDALAAVGGFDPRLGAGTPTRGGEDTLALTEVMLAGHTLVYTPYAVTWHHHRPDEDALVDQLAGYAVGLGAYYTALLMRDPSRVRHLIAAAVWLRRSAARGRAGGSLARFGGRNPREVQVSPVHRGFLQHAASPVPATSPLTRWRRLWALASGPAAYVRAGRRAPAGDAR